MRSPEELTDLFRLRGLKVTPQRQAVFRAMHGDHTHPSAETVHATVVAEMPTVSLRTVYQTLNDLVAMGEILHLQLGTGSGRFDTNVEAAHHHVVCERCAMVRDLHVDLDHVRLGDMPADFSVAGTELVVRGTCADCTTDPADPADTFPTHTNQQG